MNRDQMIAILQCWFDELITKIIEDPKVVEPLIDTFNETIESLPHEALEAFCIEIGALI